MVEGKVAESFGPTIEEWRHNASTGKQARLQFLLRTLGLRSLTAATVRYQLLHREASAIITGEQYHAAAAVLLVHSFSQELIGWPDYQSFTRLFDIEAVVGSLQCLTFESSIPLFGTWIVGNPLFLNN